MRNKNLDPLASYIGQVECFMCHKFGNMAKDCLIPTSMRPLIQKKQPKSHAQQRNQVGALWNKKEEKLGRCGISLCSRDEIEIWYIDSGHPHHMLGDRRKNHFLKKTKSGHVDFEGSEPIRALGSGKANLGEKRANVEDVWLIEGLKHNIISLSQMVDGSKEVVFKSKDLFIKEERSKRLITREVKTIDNVYVLKGRVKSKET